MKSDRSHIKELPDGTDEEVSIMLSRRAVLVAVVAISIIIVGIAIFGESKGWDSAAHQATVQYVLAILATYAGAAAVWYTIETIELRIQATRQLEFLERESQLALVPFLACSIYSPTDIDDFEEVPNNRTVVMDMLSTTAGRIKLQIQNFKDELRLRQHAWMNDQIRLRGVHGPAEFEYSPYVVVLDNPTDKIAQSIWVVVYDCDTRTYAASGMFSDYVGPNDATLLEVNEQRLTLDHIRDRHEMLYKRPIRWSNELASDDRSFFAVLFLTFDGTACMVKRHFVRDVDGSLRNVGSKFFW